MKGRPVHAMPSDTGSAMSDASITWISGSVLGAGTHRPFRVNETVLVGRQRLLGEVISWTCPTITVRHRAVVEALAEADLDPAVQFLPTSSDLVCGGMVNRKLAG